MKRQRRARQRPKAPRARTDGPPENDADAPAIDASHRRDKRRVKASLGRTPAPPHGAVVVTETKKLERRRQRIGDVDRYGMARSITRVVSITERVPPHASDLVRAATDLRPDLTARFGRLATRARRGDEYAARIVLDEAVLVVARPSVDLRTLEGPAAPVWRAAAHRMVEHLHRAYEIRLRLDERAKTPRSDGASQATGEQRLASAESDPSMLSSIASALRLARQAGVPESSTTRDVARRMLARAYMERGTRANAARGAAMNLAADLLGVSRTTLYARLAGYSRDLASAAAAFRS